MKHKHNGKDCCKGKLWTSIYWWASLIVAVIAVPSLAFIAAALIPDQGIWQIAVFISACWVSTFIGMELMKMNK